MSKDKFSTQELIKQLAKRLNLNEKLAEDFLKAMFISIEEELLKGEPVKVKNLGTFKLQWNEPRKSVDVTTGEEIMLDGYNKITFTPDPKLKDLVNEPFAYLEPILLEVDSPVLEPVKTQDSFDPLNILSGQAAEIKSLLSEISALSANNSRPADESEPKGDDELNVEFIDTQDDIDEEPVEKENFSTEDELIEEEESDELLNLDTEIIVPIDEDTVNEVESTGDIVANEVINEGQVEEIKLEEVPENEVDVINHQPETEENLNEQSASALEENVEDSMPNNGQQKPDADTVRREVPFQMQGQPAILSTPEAFTLKVKSNTKRKKGCLIFILVFLLLTGGFIVNYYLSSATRCWIKYTLLSEETANKITNFDETITDWLSGVKLWFSDNMVPEESKDAVLIKQDQLMIENDTLIADTLPDSMAVVPVEEVVDSLQLLFDGPRTYHKFLGVETIKEGSRLTLIAERYYGLRDFWVYIYEANKDRIAHPDNLPVNVEIRIPQVDKRLIDKNNPDCIKKAKELHDLYVKKKLD